MLKGSFAAQFRLNLTPWSMISEIPNFGHLALSRRASGETVRLVRSPDEVVVLAFDKQIKRLVELHLLQAGEPMEAALKKSSIERARMAAEIRGPTFMRILDAGEDEDVVYYTSNLNEGEFLADYIMRRGALPPATVFSLLLQLLDDVMLLADKPRLVPQIRLDRVMITTVEDTFLQLRLYDFGLGSAERAAGDNARQVLQVCELIFLLLTGKAFTGESPDRFPALTALPMSLRTTVRTALADPGNTPTSLEKLRDDVREAFATQVSNIQARNTRKQLVVTAALQPTSQLQDLLLEGVPVERVLGSRFRVEDDGSARRYPFSISCVNVKTDLPVTVHLLPPSRIVDKTEYDAVPLQSWRFNSEKHPNILRSLSLWESPDWSFLTEEREPGFSLGRLLTERLTLNASEVVVMLRQVNAGIEQALDCGVLRLEMHPSNLFLRVGRSGPMLAREHERLMQKRLDAWPPFHVKLRPHVTMRNLYEPPLAESPEAEHLEGKHLEDLEHRSRAFVALAVYLLTGQRQIGDLPVFPEAVPEALAAYVRETLEATRETRITPSPADFLARFESSMSAPAAPDLATRLRGSKVALEEMESAGSVSDFEEDSSAVHLEEDKAPVSPISRRLHAHEFDHHAKAARRRSSWPALAAAAMVILGLLAWWFMPRAKTAEVAVVTTPAPETGQPSPSAVVSSPPEKNEEQPATAEVVANKPSEIPADVVSTNAVPAPLATGSASSPAKPEEAPKEPALKFTNVLPGAGPVMTAPTTAPVKPPIDLSQPPAPVTVPGSVIIRKALMPTPEELARFKQGQIKPQPLVPSSIPQPVQISPSAPMPLEPGVPEQVGRLPAMKMSSPAVDGGKKS